MENLPNAAEFESEAGPSLACAHVCASDNPINPIPDNFLINKNNKNKSESVSESVKEKTENLKNQNSREIENSQPEKLGHFRKPKRFWLIPVLTKSFSKHGFHAPTEIKPASMRFFPTFFLGSTERPLTS